MKYEVNSQLTAIIWVFRMSIKLRNLRLPQGYKFVQELIFEGVWPFSRMRSPYDLLFLTLLYFLGGVGLFYLFTLPFSFLVAGTLAGIGISIGASS